MRGIAISVMLVVTFSGTGSIGTGLTASLDLTDQSRSRQIALSRGTRIPSIIAPDDEFVILERDLSQSVVTVAPHITAREEDLDERARTADIIAVAEVSGSESLLVNNDTWIETDVSIVVRQLVKDTEPTALQSGASITFRHTGGELSIGRVRVRADHFFLFKTGERYLIFVRSIRREKIVRVGLIGFPFRITNEGRLAPIPMSAGTPIAAPSPLYGSDLATVIAELKARIRPQ